MAKHVLLIFIDGLGLGRDDQLNNPLAHPNRTLASECKLIQNQPLISKIATVVPTDTCLGVEGMPQSATGQTTLLSGINAAKKLGYHKSAYPNKLLTALLTEYGIFTRCTKLGYQATFANGFSKEYWNLINTGKRKHSATTASVLGAQLPLRYEKEYESGLAIYHDITGHVMRSWGRDVPYLAPQEAGSRLAQLTKKHHFTLFEYFMTDFLGHRKELLPILTLLDNLELFINSTLEQLNLNETAVLLTSDHGNIEDLSTSNHTINPVPTILYGPAAQTIAPTISDLTDIVPAILKLLPPLN